MSRITLLDGIRAKNLNESCSKNSEYQLISSLFLAIYGSFAL